MIVFAHCYLYFLSVNMDPRLQWPFTCMVSGVTMSGKSQFVCDLIEKRESVIDTPVSDIVICYSEWQPLYETMKDTCRFVQGLIDPDELDASVPHLVVLDDLMDTQDRRIEQFFTRSCHHRNTSCIYIVQSLFNKNKGHRICSLNAQYLVLFKSPRDMSQIRVLESQMFPGKRNYLVHSFNDACEKPYQYLFLDLKPQTPTHLRLRGRVLNLEEQDVYLPKDYKWATSEQN